MTEIQSLSINSLLIGTDRIAAEEDLCRTQTSITHNLCFKADAKSNVSVQNGYKKETWPKEIFILLKSGEL